MPRCRTKVCHCLSGGLLLLGLGCGEGPPAPRVYRDIGSFCLRAGEAGVASLSVRFGDAGSPCFSSCNDNVGSCNATVINDTVQLESTATVTRGEPLCDAACAIVRATCELVVPAAGDYSFVLGGAMSVTAALPPTEEVALFGESACDP